MNQIVTAILASCTTILLVTLYIFKQSRAADYLQGAFRIFVHHSSTQGLNYLIGFCLVISACFTAFYDNFGAIDKHGWEVLGWWQIVALVSKSFSAAPVALLGFLLRSPLTPVSTPLPDGKQVTTITTENKPAP